MSLQFIAHRGYSAERPENTIASFDLAVESGFPFIELDVHLSKDGVPVVIHDFEVDRTTNSSGLVSEFTVNELQSLDNGSWFVMDSGETHPPQYIPTLEEILIRYRDRAHIVIEIKSPQPELITSMRELLRSYGWLPDAPVGFGSVPGISIISFDVTQLAFSKACLPELGHGFLALQPDSISISLCLEHGFDGLFPFLGAMTPDIVKSAKAAGLYMGAWGILRPEDLGYAIKLGISAVTVDWPGKADRFLREFPV